MVDLAQAYLLARLLLCCRVHVVVIYIDDVIVIADSVGRWR